MTPTPTSISVGQPWPQRPPGGAAQWAEGSVLDWSRRSPLTLLVVLASPTPEEERAAREGRVDVGCEGGGGLPATLLWRVRGLGDGDATLDASLYAPEDRPEPEPIGADEHGRGYLLTLVLLDAARGEVRVLRGVGLSERVSRAWRAAVLGTLPEAGLGVRGGGGRWVLAPERAGSRGGE